MTGLFAGYRRLDEAETATPDQVPPQTPLVLPARNPTSSASGPAGAAPLPVSEGEQELKRLLEARTRQWQAERLRASQVVEVLVDLASEVCKVEFDEELKQHGNLLEWEPASLKAFVLAQILPRLEISTLAQNTDLARAHQALLNEHGDLKSEHSRLRVMFELAELELEALRKRLAQAEGGAAAEDGEPVTPEEASALPAPADQEPRAERPERGRVDDLVRLVAATGLARLSKIREKLAVAWQVEGRSASMGQAVQAAQKAGFVKLFETRTDWRGAARSVFVELTPAGLAQALALGVTPAESELAEGVRRGYELGQLNLILRAADILRAEGYSSVRVFPQRVMLPNNEEHQPVLSAVDADGRQLYVACERQPGEGDRQQHWQVAAKAGGGAVWLMTTTPALQTQLVSEINLARAGQTFSVKACNVSDYNQKVRGRDGSLWLYQG